MTNPSSDVSMEPAYRDELVTVYQADCLECPELWTQADVLITDPPYGMGYQSTFWRLPESERKPRIAGDTATEARDQALRLWGDRHALVFGTWKTPRPEGLRHLLVWDKSPSPGMGDFTLPWGNSIEEVYVFGGGWEGRRRSNVLHFPPVPSSRRRTGHPTPKPVELMESLIRHCPEDWVIADPFAGSGATLAAARNLGRRAIGVEVEARYCKQIADTLSQPTLPVTDVEVVDRAPAVDVAGMGGGAV